MEDNNTSQQPASSRVTIWPNRRQHELEEVKAWAELLVVVADGCGLRFLIDRLHRLLSVPPDDRTSALERLEKACHESPPVVAVRLLGALYHMKPPPRDPGWRLDFIRNLLRHRCPQVQEAAIDLSVRWGRRSRADARKFHWLLGQIAGHGAGGYAEVAVDALDLVLQGEGNGIADEGLAEDFHVADPLRTYFRGSAALLG